MSTTTSSPPSEPIPAFTATGRPHTHQPRNSAAEAFMTADAIGHGAPHLLPVKFNDDSIISVPVLKQAQEVNAQAADDNDAGAKNGRGSRKLSFFSRRKSSANGDKVDFTMRHVTRREYLARYAKDEQGRYVGSEEPAEDCILRGEDLVKYRKDKGGGGAVGQQGVANGGFRHEIDNAAPSGGSAAVAAADGDSGGTRVAKRFGMFRSTRKGEDEVIR